ncbi:MAG TPA: hypothetical protein VNU97_16035 [Rhizomicrobium sp.]|jgi:hypothetical protein|nr:hypothetical protein [Rhizomicrobium sp.]
MHVDSHGIVSEVVVWIAPSGLPARFEDRSDGPMIVRNFDYADTRPPVLSARTRSTR